MLKIKLNKMSNEELFKLLKENNIQCGPITDTTRSIYEKRLLKNFEILGNEEYTESDLNALSNEDLHSLLKEKNLNPGPVTSTTRQVYVKKLLALKNNESRRTSPTARSVESDSVTVDTNFVEYTESDLNALSDQDLFDLLVRKNLNPGPVNDTTRRLYIKKLLSLQNKKSNESLSSSLSSAAATTTKTKSIMKSTPTSRTSQNVSNNNESNMENNDSTSESMIYSDSTPLPLGNQQIPSVFPSLSMFKIPSLFSADSASTLPGFSMSKSESTSSLMRHVRFEDDQQPTQQLQNENENAFAQYAKQNFSLDHNNNEANNLNEIRARIQNDNKRHISPPNESMASKPMTDYYSLFPGKLLSTKNNYFDNYTDSLHRVSNRKPLHNGWMDHSLFKTNHSPDKSSYINRNSLSLDKNFSQSNWNKNTEFLSKSDGSLYNMAPPTSYMPSRVSSVYDENTLAQKAFRLCQWILNTNTASSIGQFFLNCLLFLILTCIIYLIITFLNSNQSNPIDDL